MIIALAQINTLVGDLPGNCDKIIKSFRYAKENNADLVVFPEMVISGYPPRDLLEKKSFLDDCEKAYKKLLSELPLSPAALIGLPVLNADESLPFNAARISTGDKIISEFHKFLLPAYDVFDESRYFSPGKNFHISPEICGRKFAVTICEDLLYEFADRYKEYPLDNLKKLSPDFIVNISASPFVAGKPEKRFRHLSGMAKKNHLPVIYVNAVGGNDELVFDGSSFVVDENGQSLDQLPSFEESLVIYDEENSAPAPLRFDAEITSIKKALVLGTRDYFQKLHFKKAVLGLSGGIDSSVTAALAVEALGCENVLGVSMPSRYSSEGSVDDAKSLAKNLNIKLEIIPIKNLFREYLTSLNPLFQGLPADVAEENIQARIRGNLLMALSNKFGYLVLSTGNKSEMAVGYCTLYGDMAGGLAVISDVPKTCVYKLAEEINRGKEIIPKPVIDKPPSAELRPDQTDQDTLPPYEILDRILAGYIEQRKSIDEIVEKGIPADTVQEVIRLVNRNEYKRKQAPIGLKVTSKAFGQGRRYPIAVGGDKHPRTSPDKFGCK